MGTKEGAHRAEVSKAAKFKHGAFSTIKVLDTENLPRLNNYTVVHAPSLARSTLDSITQE